MKALYFYGDLYVGSQLIEEARPEMLFPIARDLSGITSDMKTEAPVPTPSKDKTFVKLVFRMVDRGKDHAIYKLKGFEE